MGGPMVDGGADFDGMLSSFVADSRVYGAAAAVVYGDKLAWSGSTGFADAGSRRQVTTDTLFRLASLTKTFTGAAVMRLRDEGKLDLDDAVARWLPELAASLTATVTIRRLLSHESGLTIVPPGTDMSRCTDHAYGGQIEQTLTRAAEIVTVIGPDLQPKYSSLGYQLLGEIVHRASGVPYRDYVRRGLLAPLGMTATCFDPPAAQCAIGYSARVFTDELEVATELTDGWAEFGLWSTAEDMGRWLTFQLSAYGGATESAVLASATLREMHKPRYLSDETWTSAWGISWTAARMDDTTWVLHSGLLCGFTSTLCFDRESLVGAVVLVNGIADTSTLAMRLAAAARHLTRASAPVPRLPVRTPLEYVALLGLYATPGLDTLYRVEWQDGRLVMVVPGYACPVPLDPADETDTFVAGLGFRESGETVRFHRLSDGRVTSVYFGTMTLQRLSPVSGSA